MSAIRRNSAPRQGEHGRTAVSCSGCEKHVIDLLARVNPGLEHVKSERHVRAADELAALSDRYGVPAAVGYPLLSQEDWDDRTRLERDDPNIPSPSDLGLQPPM